MEVCAFLGKLVPLDSNTVIIGSAVAATLVNIWSSGCICWDAGIS